MARKSVARQGVYTLIADKIPAGGDMPPMRTYQPPRLTPRAETIRREHKQCMVSTVKSE